MSRLYEAEHRKLQDEFGTRALADGVEAAVVTPNIPPAHESFIESRDMFFLSTIDPQGRPTVSYKGGDPGFLKIINDTTLVFPSYDGNGMFYSMGNAAANPNVGLLFVDFEQPNRLRVQGQARLLREHPLNVVFPEADLLVEVAVTEVWVNCPRYVHRYTQQQASEYVPRPNIETPVALWKRIDVMQPLLSEADQQRSQAAGIISQQDYQMSLTT